MSQVELKTCTIYKTLYSEMIEGDLSKTKSMHGGLGGRHNKEYRNPLADKIALAITARFQNPNSVTEAEVDQIVKALKVKL